MLSDAVYPAPPVLLQDAAASPKGFFILFYKLTPLSDLCCKALGGNDRHRTDRLWQDLEPRCHSGRDATVTGRGRRTRLPR